MCGITGASWTDPARALPRETLERMTRVLTHRGPDDEGRYEQPWQQRSPYEPMPGVALGFRRLSIIDLAGGHQPMSNEDGTVWIVFNGEIYNYAALRRRLEGAGHHFQSDSDTETIVHLYEDLGLECFEHLNGMFAMAIWDARQRRLVLARDRVGKKPLFYRHDAGRLLFGSELKCLMQVHDVPREIDPAAVDAYLTYQYVPYPRTIFRGTSKLPPGHLAVYQDDHLEVRPYWQPALDQVHAVSRHEAVEQLQDLLRSAVELRMRSDVPLGAFLSGGVDSSLVTALMQEKSSRPVKTFSIGFPVAEYDESRYARMVAQHLGTEHHEFEVTPDALEILPQLVWHYDEPFADSSAIPTWYVSRMTRQHVTVALSGDGGDELFLGYPRYRAVWLASRLDNTGALRNVLAAPRWQTLPGNRQKSLIRRFKRFSEFLGQSPARRYLQWIAIYHEHRRAALYTPAFLATLPDEDPVGFLEKAWSRAGTRDPVSAAGIADLTSYLPCDILNKVDIASMAHSLECRAPLLDYRIVEFATGLPRRHHFRWGRGKRLLRQAFGHLLPQEIWTRRKMGFGVPLDHWFRNELRPMAEQLLMDETARRRGYFRPEAVREMIDQHVTGKFDHAYRLWSLLILELWLREWVDRQHA